ncbi:DMT family transporter (plasmid) [Skermanella mucosa]|uniref:DMT family transporter n=1 Tax=Skermanella mucosa TaxID=1789672 RepID=UPI00192BA5B5|nr:DMT family transporter [Skermanella mucosa]UEM24854.1 DMT family transporter [Skermanella mucosa]
MDKVMEKATACGTAGTAKRGRGGAGRAAPSALMLFALQAAMVVAWSAGFVGYRYAAEHAPTFLISFWRFALAAPLLLPFALPALRAAPSAAMGRQALIGVFAICGYLAPIAKSIEYGVPAGLAALAADLLPLAVAGVSVILPGRRMGGLRWFGVGIGAVGALLVAGESFRLGSAPAWAYGLPVIGMLSLAVATLIQEKTGGTDLSLPIMATLFIQVCVSVPVFGVLALLEGGIAPVMSPEFGLSLLWLVLVPTLGGYGLYWICLRLGSAESASGALYLSPPVTMIWAYAVFDEPLSIMMAVGMCLSLIGLFSINRGVSRDASK